MGLLMFVWRKGPNCWIGVRTPWTFADREIWDKSWILAAVLLLGMGAGVLWVMPLFVGSLAALVVLGILYPLWLYRRRYGTWRYWRDIGLIQYRPAARCPQCGHIQKLQEAEELLTARCEVCGTPLAR
jgi:hypothetical protein